MHWKKNVCLVPWFLCPNAVGGIYDAEHEEDDPLGITFLHFDIVARRGKKRSLTREVSRNWPEFFDLQDLAFFDAISRRIVQHFPQAPDTATVLLTGLLSDLLQSPLMLEGPHQDEAASAHRRRILKMVDDVRLGLPPRLRLSPIWH